MTDDEHKFVYELLKNIFSNLNNWLTFAEAKNAAIIAFNIACLSFLFSIEWIAEIKIFVYIVSVGIIISIIMALNTFIPKMGKEIDSYNYFSETDNLLFYRDIAKYDVDNYLKLVFKKYRDIDVSDNDIHKIEKDLAREIIYNAKVATRKYELFNKAINVDIVVFISMIVLLFVS